MQEHAGSARCDYMCLVTRVQLGQCASPEALLCDRARGRAAGDQKGPVRRPSCLRMESICSSRVGGGKGAGSLGRRNNMTSQTTGEAEQ